MIKNIKERPLTESFNASIPSILNLKFPFNLTKDQHKAVDAWFSNKCRGSLIYSTGTGKTEIAFECARRRAAAAAEHEKKIKLDNNNIVDCNNNNNIIQKLQHRSIISYCIMVQKMVVYKGSENRIED